MKIVSACEHLEKSAAANTERAQALGNPAHDGRFFLVVEMCEPCFRAELTGKNINALVGRGFDTPRDDSYAGDMGLDPTAFEMPEAPE